MEIKQKEIRSTVIELTIRSQPKYIFFLFLVSITTLNYYCKLVTSYASLIASNNIDTSTKAYVENSNVTTFSTCSLFIDVWSSWVGRTLYQSLRCNIYYDVCYCWFSFLVRVVYICFTRFIQSTAPVNADW